MKRIFSIVFCFGLSLILFAGNGVSVIANGTSSHAKNSFVKQSDVKVILKENRFFYVEKYLGENDREYLFLKEGKKVAIPKALVKEIKLHMAVNEGIKEKKKTAVKKEKKRGNNKKKLVLTDYNVEKTVYSNEKEGKEEVDEAKNSSALSIKVENQVIQRKKDTITFKANIKNATNFKVGKLSIILNIYDSKGKLVEKKKVFLANSLDKGKSIPFTYSMKDPDGKITRFDYSFEGIVFKPVEKEE